MVQLAVSTISALTGRIGAPCVPGNGTTSVAASFLMYRGQITSSGRFLALGASRRNSCIEKRDRESAIRFLFPAIWMAEMVKLCLAQTKKSLRSSCISGADLLLPDFTPSTTAELSK